MNLKVLFACVVGALFLSTSIVMAADRVVGKQVPSSQRMSTEAFDHADWNRLLQKYVDVDGMVNYAAWQKSKTDRVSLERYLVSLSSSTGEGSTPTKLSFWINAYNALTIHGILQEYPTTSIRNHTAVLFGYNIWKNLKLVVGDRTVSLEEIEHEILRKMNEPRIHFAIVCASIGCPRLLNEAYVADRLETQLELNSKHFFSQPSKFKFDRTRKVVSLSPILKWFEEDFGNNKGEVLAKIARWLSPQAASELGQAGAVSVQYQDYDWGLNAQ